ncbi:MAG TPA: hypothetical protein VFY84_03510 [Jiangellales bacterium]|nr:hypothetical protein [Jiangellales bacterium]
MTYAPEHTFVHVAYRQQQLRHEADAYRRARGYRVVPRRRTRGAVGKAAVAVVARIRRSVDSLTEWPHPV